MVAVQVTRRAAAQIARAADWWAVNRPAAPGAVVDDFDKARRLLALQPGIGAKCSSPRHPALRRLFLSRIGYHIYYHEDREVVVVLAFWHASRGGSPSL